MFLGVIQIIYTFVQVNYPDNELGKINPYVLLCPIKGSYFITL